MKLAHQGWIFASFLYFVLILGIMLLASLGYLAHFPLARPPYDKLGHFILYGIASFLFHRASGRRMIAIFHYPIPLGPFVFTLFTIAEEMLQAIFPKRTASLEDLVASLAGIMIFYTLGELWQPKKIPSQK